MNSNDGWTGFTLRSWTDLRLVRERLDAGADPNAQLSYLGRPLDVAAEYGSPEVVAELARRVDDVDAVSSGRTALWRAVYGDRPGNARALVAAGADPWRSMMAGWSPGRLSLAGPTPDLFDPVPPSQALTPDEQEAVQLARHLRNVLGQLWMDGLGLACVAGIDVAEAVRRLDAQVMAQGAAAPEQAWADPLSKNALLTVGATDVPGGCVISQPWGFLPQVPEVTTRLSVGTVCYGLYANPKSGDQGSIVEDGTIGGWDLHPGGGADEHDPPELVLAAYLYRNDAVAYSCGYARLRPPDARAITGPPDVWLRLSERYHP